MQHDHSELTPGRKDFWDDFYDADGGRLSQKEASHRRAEELQERGSLMNHYEWFMEFPLYEADLVSAIRQNLTLPVVAAREGPRGLRVLHIGCGNSDFCDHVQDVVSSALTGPQGITQSPEVLNVDVCENILTHLLQVHPARLYAVGSCCELTGGDGTTVNGDASAAGASPQVPWYETGAPSSPGGCARLLRVSPGSVDLVFDKGTVDALLSAFVGEFNDNVAAYAEESLKVLHPGGLLFLISINSADTLDSYFLSASAYGRYFHLCYESTIHLSKHVASSLRVETLGSRYNCRAYVVRSE